MEPGLETPARPTVPEPRRSVRKRRHLCPETPDLSEACPERKTRKTMPGATAGRRAADPGEKKKASPQESPPTSLDDLKGLILGVDRKIDGMENTLGERIDKVEASLDDRFKDVEDEVGELRRQMADSESALDLSLIHI